MRFVLFSLLLINFSGVSQCGLQYNSTFDNCTEINVQLKKNERVDTNSTCVKYQIKEDIFLQNFTRFNHIISLNLICNNLNACDLSFPNIENLRIECSRINKGEKFLNNLIHVKYLSIYATNEKDIAISLPQKLDSIKTLFIGKTSQLTFDNRLCDYASLENFGIYEFSKLTVSDRILNLKNLKMLMLQGKLRSKDISLIAKLPNLICLSVYDLEDFTILRDFERLVELNLYGAFSKKQLEKIKNDFPKIKIIHWGKLIP